MLVPERMVGYCLDLVRRLAYPAFAPDVDDAVGPGLAGDEPQWHFEDDRVAVLARARVPATVDKSIIPGGIFLVAVSGPGVRAGWQVEFDRVPVLGVRGIVVEQVVAFEFEQRLGDWQLTKIGPGVRHVVELWRVVDGTEEARQVIEEGVVPAADECVNSEPVRRGNRRHLAHGHGGRETAAGEIVEGTLACPCSSAVTLISAEFAAPR